MAGKKKPSRCGSDDRKEKALLKRRSAGLTDEEMDKVLAYALLSLDSEGLNRVVSRLG